MKDNRQTYLRNMANKICICAILFLIAASGVAQDKITFSRQTLSRREAINEIKVQTSYQFAINHSQFDDKGLVYFTNITLPIREALNQLLANTGQTYLIQGQQILVLTIESKKEPKETVKEKTGITGSGTKQKTPPYSSTPQRNVPVQQSYQNVPTQQSYWNEPPKDNIENEVQQYMNNIIAPQIDSKPVSTTPEVNETKKQSLTTETQKIPHKTIPIGYTTEPVMEYKSYLTEAPARFAIKTNLLYDLAGLTPNLGVEIGISRKISLELMVGFNPFGDKDSEDGEVSEKIKKRKHLLIKPEVRYWLCERLNGHYIGVHPFYANYNVGGYKIPLLFEKEYLYEGNSFGIGVSYGYHWMLSSRWGLEFNVGVGFAYMDYDKFCNDKTCDETQGGFTKQYFGPTSLGIKLVYTIK